MGGMWELPQQDTAPNRNGSSHWRTFRHSITVTNYTVHVLRGATSDRKGAGARSKWVTVKDIPKLPITGLTRKILKADGII